MNTIKGFATIKASVNNAYGKVSEIGELSFQSLSYAKDKTYYTSRLNDGVEFTMFKTIDENKNHIVLDNTIVDIISEVLIRLSDYSTTRTKWDYIDFKNHISTTLYNTIINFDMGKLVEYGRVYLPEWYSFSVDGNNIKIWLSDQAFQNQYDEYEISIIPGVSNIDSLFDNFDTVKSNLKLLSVKKLIDKINEKKSDYPESYLRIEEYNLVSDIDKTDYITTYWGVLIYGRAGDNQDVIKETIEKYILDNSQHSANDWQRIIPDLFKRTEFTIVPRWDKVSIPNLGSLCSLYSSIINPSECVQFCVNNIKHYDMDFVRNNVTILPFNFKGILLNIIPGDNNAEGKTQFSQIFSDYIAVGSSSLDFNRMAISTRDISELLEKLLVVAENSDEYSYLPSDMRRVKRNGVFYISKMLNDINYLVACKHNSFYK